MEILVEMVTAVAALAAAGAALWTAGQARKWGRKEERAFPAEEGNGDDRMREGFLNLMCYNVERKEDEEG